MHGRPLIWRSAARLLILLAALAPAIALAEILDELTVFAERTDAVIRITFGTRIQYLRHTAIGNDLFEVYIQVVTVDATAATETRRIAPTASFPGVEVTYPLQQVAQQQRLTVRFSSPVTLRVRPGGNRAIDLVIPGAARLLARPPAPAAAGEPGPATEARFAVRLDTFNTPAEMSRARPIPGEFSDYAVFSAPAAQKAAPAQDLLLGHFATREAAEQARDRLLQRFPAATVVDRVARAPEPAGATASPAAAPPAPAATTDIAAPVPAPAEPPAAAEAGPALPAAPTSSAEIETRAAELMTGARAALDAGNSETAIEQINRVLMLPPNLYSQEAQELAGLARERGGETAKARAEYELYLKLYPEGEGAARVRNRLAGLPAPGTPAAVRRERAPLRATTGSISQYYYHGQTKVDSVFNTPTTVDRTSFSATDQSSLVTNVDLMHRNRTASSDTRLVFRDTNNRNFLSSGNSYNRLNAAFYDYRGLDNPLTARVGRQTGLSGGLPNRFDGALAGYGFAGKWRLNAAAGVPVEYPSIDSSRHFLATNLEFEGLAEAWSGNFFFIDQRVDGILDRRAVGAETRYFDAKRSLFSLVDYDTNYSVWNITMVQGTWQTEGGTTLNLLYDRRRAPLLTTTNAIFGQGTSSISTLLQTQTADQVRQQARDVTAIATQSLIGFTTPVTPKWQAGADVRYTSVGALPSVVVNGIVIPAQPATGNIYSYDLQAIGTNLYSNRDTSVFSGTYLTGPTQDGRLLSYNNLTVFGGRWTVEPSIRYYTQHDNQGIKLVRWTPGLRLTYRVLDKLSLESEFNWERARTTSATSEDVSSRGFFFLGYRLDI